MTTRSLLMRECALTLLASATLLPGCAAETATTPGGDVDTEGTAQARTGTEAVGSTRQADSIAGDAGGASNTESADQQAIVLDPAGPFPVTFQVPVADVTPVAGGIQVVGAMTLPTPIGNVQMLDVNVVFGGADDAGAGYTTLNGQMSLPIPTGAGFAGFTIAGTTPTQVGYDLGQNIETDQSAPIDPSRKYLYFDTTNGFDLRYANASIVGPGGAVRVFLDPSDPFFYAKVALTGLPEVGSATVGMGISGSGLLPFQPQNTWGIEGNVQAFQGNVILEGELPLLDAPFTLEGQTVYGITPPASGQSAPHIQIGANDKLNLSVDFVEGFSFDVPFLTATLGAQFGDTWDAYFSGNADPDVSWVPSEIPLLATQNLKVAGHVSSDMSQSVLRAQGTYTISGSSLSQKVGIDLSDLAVAKGQLTIDKTGFRVQGQATASFTPVVALSGTAAVDALFGQDPNAWYAQIAGSLGVHGVQLAGATARADRAGLVVNGSLSTVNSSVAMSGTITRSGGNLKGVANVSVPLTGLGTFLQEVTSAADCGWDYGQSAANCGVTWANDAAYCGTILVQSGADCGYSWVTDAAKCGTTTVTGFAECGAQCVSSLFSNCSCQVPNSCSWPKICQVPKYCPVPNTCKWPASCQITSSTPNYNFGTFTGKVVLTVGTNGLTGQAAGVYTDPTGTSHSVAASVDIDPGQNGSTNVQVCVPGIQGADISGGLGQVCASI